MEYDNMRFENLKALMKEHGLRDCSKLKKPELIELLWENDRSRKV